MSKVLEYANSVDEILALLSAEEKQHMLRVGGLAVSFTEKLQLDGVVTGDLEECRRFGRAAFYHDIGKAWIPRAILTKPGRLTEEERLTLRGHPMFARHLFDRVNRGLVTGIPEYLVWLAADSAVYHHERWDGSGYPFGIGCCSIPLVARITAICDAYDAMTSDRIYRKGHSREYALHELEKCSGTQFDPELVEIFLSVEPGSVLLPVTRPSCP